MQSQKVHIQASTLIPRYGCVTSTGALANSNIAAHESHVIGVTDGRIEATAWGDVTVLGLLYDQTWAWTPGGIIYLNGTVLSQTAPVVGFVQQMGWALTGQNLLIHLRNGVGAPGPAGPASIIIRNTWSPAPPPDPTINTLCIYRDGTASRTWDAVFAAWI